MYVFKHALFGDENAFLCINYVKRREMCTYICVYCICDPNKIF